MIELLLIAFYVLALMLCFTIGYGLCAWGIWIARKVRDGIHPS